MKTFLLPIGPILSLSLSLGLLATASAPARAAPQDCEALKARIAAKVEGKGVKHYELTIIDKKDKLPGRLVGRCELGSRKIIYRRTSA